jgi:hypothetical protein
MMSLYREKLKGVDLSRSAQPKILVEFVCLASSVTAFARCGFQEKVQNFLKSYDIWL